MPDSGVPGEASGGGSRLAGPDTSHRDDPNRLPLPDQPSFDFDAWSESGYPPIVPPFEKELSEAELNEAGRQVRDFFLTLHTRKWTNKHKDTRIRRVAFAEERRLSWMFPEVYIEVCELWGEDSNLARRDLEGMARSMHPKKYDRFRRGWDGMELKDGKWHRK